MKPDAQVLTEWATGEFVFDVGYGPQTFKHQEMERLVRYINGAYATDESGTLNEESTYVIFEGGMKVQLYLGGDARYRVTMRGREVTLRELMRFEGLQKFIDAN